ncbi:MAG: PIN domain-containing protein [Chloroflexi bacterium]|nr:PIN domain-containing protein [Chloroflexota bacterium]
MRLADTNVLLYAVSNQEDDAEKKTTAAATLVEPDLALSVQVLQEFYHQATRPHGPAGLTHEQAIEFLRPLGTLPTQAITVELFARATGIRSRFGVSYWDAAILAAAKLLGCEAVYSEDLSHEQDYDGVMVINPFLDERGAEEPTP